MVNDILRLIPVIQSAQLASDNLDFIEKKRKSSRDFIKQGTKNLVGISLIGATTSFID